MPELPDVEVYAERLGERLVLDFGDEVLLVLHLMIAGRLRMRRTGAGLPGRIGLAAFDFEHATLLLTEASKKKRASLVYLRRRGALAAHHRGGVEPLEVDARGAARAAGTRAACSRTGRSRASTRTTGRSASTRADPAPLDRA